MNDKAKAFCAEVQALLRQHNVGSIEAVGPHGNDQFRIAFGGSDDLVLVQLEQIAIWEQTQGASGTYPLNTRQKPFVSGLQGVMKKHGVQRIQSIAISAANQGIAYIVEFHDQLHFEVAAITQNEIREPPEPGTRDTSTVLATWTMKTGPANGQPTRTQTWTYTQADHDADIAGAGDPGGEVPDFVTPMSPPHNIFTRRQWDAWYMAFMQPNPGVTNWVQLEFVWEP